jgi:hypothetical protein
VCDDSENKDTPLTQRAGPSRQATVDVYSSQSELSYPISLDDSHSSKKSNIDRRSYQSPSQSYRVCSNKNVLH